MSFKKIVYLTLNKYLLTSNVGNLNQEMSYLVRVIQRNHF